MLDHVQQTCSGQQTHTYHRNGGHLITIRFEPNDIGKADFRAERIAIENGVLIMTRLDLQLQLYFKHQAK